MRLIISIIFVHLRNSDLRSVLSIIVDPSVTLQVLDELAQVIRVDLISFKCISSSIHELNHLQFRGIRSNALLLHLYFVLFDSLHLISQLLSVVR